MNDNIGELIVRYRYWSERAAHHTNSDATRRCAARAERLKQAIKEELGYALARVRGLPRGLEVGDAELRAYCDEIDGDGSMRYEIQLDLPLPVARPNGAGASTMSRQQAHGAR